MLLNLTKPEAEFLRRLLGLHVGGRGKYRRISDKVYDKLVTLVGVGDWEFLPNNGSQGTGCITLCDEPSEGEQS